MNRPGAPLLEKKVCQNHGLQMAAGAAWDWTPEGLCMGTDAAPRLSESSVEDYAGTSEIGPGMFLVLELSRDGESAGNVRVWLSQDQVAGLRDNLGAFLRPS